MKLRDLKPGARFLRDDGEEWELEYINECRAYIRKVHGKAVTVKGKSFERSVHANVSPNAEVTIG